MPLSLACLMTGLSFSRSDGLTMIALTPCEMRLRRSAICSVGPPLRLATTTLLTLPLASASALTEQIISSRQPLPTRVLLTPTTHFFSPPPPPPALLLLLPPHAASATANSPQVASATTLRMPDPAICPSPSCLGLPPWGWAGPGASSLQRASPAGLLAVGRLEERRGALRSRDRRGGDHRWHHPTFHQQRRGLHLDLVDHRHAGERRGRSHRLLQPVERDQGVAHRRAQVDHQVGGVEQPPAAGTAALGRARVRHRGDADHPQAASPGALGHLDRHRGDATDAEDEHHVAGPEGEVR